MFYYILLRYILFSAQLIPSYTSSFKCGDSRNGPRIKPNTHHINLARIVTLGSDVSLQCHICGKTNKMGGQNISSVIRHIKWYRFDRVLGKDVELLLDTHDEDALNRVTTDMDNTLIIKKFEIKDAGTYYCRNMDSHQDFLFQDFVPSPDPTINPPDLVNPFPNFTVSTTARRKGTEQTAHFKIFYHLDVVDAIENEITRGMLPKYPDFSSDGLIIYSEWSPWGPCSVCRPPHTGTTVAPEIGSDFIGERRRFGRCQIKSATPRLGKEPGKAIFYAILKTYQESGSGGIPCNSSVFTIFHHFSSQFTKARKRPNEIKVENCLEVCQLPPNDINSGLLKYMKSTISPNSKSSSKFKLLENSEKEESDGGSKLSFLKIESYVAKSVKKAPTITVEAEEGDSVDLYCPGIAEHKNDEEDLETEFAIRWQNGSHPISSLAPPSFTELEEPEESLIENIGLEVLKKKIVEIDEYFVLHIVPVERTDQGEYSCWNIKDNRKLIRINLYVKESIVVDESIKDYFFYVLLGYIFYAIVFVICLAARLTNTNKQVFISIRCLC